MKQEEIGISMTSLQVLCAEVKRSKAQNVICHESWEHLENSWEVEELMSDLESMCMDHPIIECYMKFSRDTMYQIEKETWLHMVSKLKQELQDAIESGCIQ